MDKLLILIDGNSLMNRAYYALPELMNKKGQHTNAIYGFANILFKIMDTYKPSHISVAFDLKAPTFRHKQYDAYKGNRKKMPDELRKQVEPLKKMIDAFGINRIELEGYEADDLIGTVAKNFEQDGFEVYIITGDKDALQLVSDKIKVLFTKKGISELDEYDPDKMTEKYELTPQQFIDLKGLMGDQSDNIPGVAGIGEKTGIKLLKEYGSIENIYMNIDEISKSVKAKLEAGYDMAFLSKSLATIMVDIPLELKVDEFEKKDIDKNTLISLFSEFEFNSLIGKVGNDESGLIDKVQKEYLISNDIELLIDKATSLKSLNLFSIAKSGLVSDKRLINLFVKIDEDFFNIEEKDVLKLKDVFENPEIKKYGYNLKNDCLILKPYEINLTGLYFDIAIAEYLIDSTSSNYEIKDIALKYNLGDVLSLEELLGKGKSKKDFKDLSDAQISGYACSVLDIVDNGKEALITTIENYTMHNLFYEVEMPLVEILADMEYIGISADKEVLNELKQKFDIEIKTLEVSIYEYAGENFNINSPKQLGHILFDKLGLPAIKKTKTGYSTNAEVLEALSDKHPIIDKITLYRQYTKLQSTYVDGLLNIINPKTGRIHSSFNQTITTTGRISSTEPNMQNIPVRLEIGRELRKVFVAPEDMYLVDADYSQIELRILAHIANDEGLIDAFSKGDDIHTITASEVFNVPLDEVTKELRSAAKAVNFGIVYGISDFGLSNNLGISKQVAKEYIDNYFARYPYVKKYMEDIVEKAKNDGYVETYIGRRRYIPELGSNNFIMKNLGKRLAMNTPIQGSAADVIKIAMVKVYARLKSEGLKSKLILQVHDELIIESPDSEKSYVADLLKEEMESAVDLNVKLTVDAKWGKSWYETK
ncbi:DNA polymerase I [Acetoanaerobium noterae]|uniref:DNA polymerase I n=1 Tax=Acetoanaerobium noterae TaxID=745369 RepID=A0A1T5CFN7_9FIRM|nr:DNA polymerase I [Acetoanaerobium noterae]SKB58239.1 DNA polymerase I [Acetoanaerobium noterae]